MVDVSKRLRYNRFNPQRVAHIQVDYEKCRSCAVKPCVTACPAHCYVLHAENGIDFHHEECLECGTCYIICDCGALRWEYPGGGFGISFRFS